MNASEKVNFISNWIKNYVNNMPSKAESLVIGISGGIDSSVSSTLSAMTGLKTIVLSMPIKQKSHQHDLSLKHQEWLVKNFKNVEAHTINLDELFLAFSSSLSNFNNEHGMANSRARLRMTTLYQVAAANKGIVVGTGNKVEDFGVGFYTKYGDGGVDISPIADCNKTEVLQFYYNLLLAIYLPHHLRILCKTQHQNLQLYFRFRLLFLYSLQQLDKALSFSI